MKELALLRSCQKAYERWLDKEQVFYIRKGEVYTYPRLNEDFEVWKAAWEARKEKK